MQQNKITQSQLIYNDDDESSDILARTLEARDNGFHPVFLSVGNLLNKFLANKEFHTFLKGRMILVLVHPLHLQEVLLNPTSRANARDLNIIIALQSFDHNYKTTFNDRQYFNQLLYPTSSVSQFAFQLIQEVMTDSSREREKLYCHVEKNSDTNCTFNHSSSNGKKSMSIIRAIMLPNNYSGFQYSSVYPLFLETKFVFELTDKGTVATKTPVSYYYASPLEMHHYMLIFRRNCSNDQYRIKYLDYVTGTDNVVNWDTSNYPLLVIPNLENITLQISCLNNNYSSITLLCYQLGDEIELECVLDGNTLSNRFKRSLNFPALSLENLSVKMNRSPKAVAFPSDRTSVPEGKVREGRFYFVGEYGPDDRWENFKSLVPQMFGCIGATGGCTFCFIFLFFTVVNISPGVCMGACAAAIGGSCSTVFSLGIQRMMHQTVICSELHRQGLLPDDSYLADASFGLRVGQTHPGALRMYRVLATPVVEIMKKSDTFTVLVSTLSEPWIIHMEFSEGLRDKDSYVGRWIVKLALPVLEFLDSCVTSCFNLILPAILIGLSFNIFKRGVGNNCHMYSMKIILIFQ